jgi:hypothetical protein
MQRSHHWANGRFVNPEEIRDDLPGALTAMFHLSPDATPRDPVNVLHPDPALFATPPPSGLRVTWFGHSSTLVEIDGLRILTDPLWSNTAPSTSHDRGRPVQPRLARFGTWARSRPSVRCKWFAGSCCCRSTGEPSRWPPTAGPSQSSGRSWRLRRPG